jgi:hypothetical protein
VTTVPALKNRVRGQLQRAGILPPPLPIYEEAIAPSDRVTARRLVVAALHDALTRGDYEQAAMLNATLSQEAFQRAYRTLKAWETVRDSNTGLVPHAASPFYNEWDSEDVAADLFPHLLIAGTYLDPDNTTSWVQALTNEREICGPLSCRIELASGTVVEEDLDTRLFGTSEYAKDGLLAITERFGPGPWLDRMNEGIDAILDAAYVETQAGLIPSNGTEANGELLQVLTRLYWATGDERYLQMAERIGEAYLFRPNVPCKRTSASAQPPKATERPSLSAWWITVARSSPAWPSSTSWSGYKTGPRPTSTRDLCGNSWTRSS